MADNGQEVKGESIDKVNEAMMQLESLTNRFGSRHDLERLAMGMASMHKTLVQSFTGGFIIPFVRELARMKRAERFDARNEESCNACLCMCEALEAKYGIKEGDLLRFAMI
jgi:hypothetical protein